MGRTRRWAVTVASVLSVAAAGLAGCGGEATGTRDGQYLGDRVSFRLTGATAHDFRLTGIECRVPHPEHPELALCLVRAPGLPSGALTVSGGAFGGQLGDVAIEGRLLGDGAEGTWRFEATCPNGDACEASGAWTAAFKPEVTFDVPPDLPPDVGPPDTLASDLPGPGPDAGPTQQQAKALLDDLRAAVGVAPAAWDDGVHAAAQAHAEYFVTHASAYAQSGLNPHQQNQDWTEGFTGVSMMQRLQHAGVTGVGAGGEVMAFTGSAQGAMDGWMATLYHREPLIHPSMVRWGFGAAAEGAARAEVADLIFAAAAKPGPARWPLPDAEDVDRSWDGRESPQPPLPPGASYPSGPIVTVTWPSGTKLALAEARLLGPGDVEVPVQVRTPADDQHLMDSWALYALDPLAAGTRYTVVFEGTVGGQATTESWSFTTR